MEGLDALMDALKVWNGGSIVISHDEKFITTVAHEVSQFNNSLSILNKLIVVGLCKWK